MTLNATSTSEAEATGADESIPRRCVCPVCGTDEFLVLRHVRTCRLPGRKDTTGWDVGYRCSNCDRYQEHLTERLPAGWEV